MGGARAAAPPPVLALRGTRVASFAMAALPEFTATWPLGDLQETGLLAMADQALLAVQMDSGDLLHRIWTGVCVCWVRKPANFDVKRIAYFGRAGSFGVNIVRRNWLAQLLQDRRYRQMGHGMAVGPMHGN